MIKGFVAAAMLLLLTQANASAFTRDYVADGHLTLAEEKIILQLVKRRGIENVAKIQTYYVEPSPWVAIMVTEVEQRLGNQVKYRMVCVSKKGWYDDSANSKDKTVLGDFTAARETEMVLDVFLVGKKEYRVWLQDGISRNDAEQILRLLISGRIEYRTTKPEHMEQWDLSSPARMSRDKDGKHFSVSFNQRYGGSAGCGFTLSIEGDRLIVTDVVIWVA